MDLQAFFKMSYGLYVLSAAFDGKQNGCIVNTVTQVTAEPPKATVAVSKQNLTTELIEQSGFFNAVPLTEKATMDRSLHAGTPWHTRRRCNAGT